MKLHVIKKPVPTCSSYFHWPHWW